MLPTGGGDLEADPARRAGDHAPPDTTTTSTSSGAPRPTPPPVLPIVDELLELQLQRLRFRGARAFLWRYREHLDTVRWALQVLEEGRDAGRRGGIRNPGGFVRWQVKEEVGDGDGA